MGPDEDSGPGRADLQSEPFPSTLRKGLEEGNTKLQMTYAAGQAQSESCSGGLDRDQSSLGWASSSQLTPSNRGALVGGLVKFKGKIPGWLFLRLG